MPRPDRGNALDHVVVLMFENHSSDNLLGRLYEPGEVTSFEGVTGKDLSNPIPDWAADQGPGGGVVPYGVATDTNTPSPDPGEGHQHVNTQLYGSINPLSNRGLLAHKMTAPYNAPADLLLQPTMDGFVADYISTFTAEMGKAAFHACTALATHLGKPSPGLTQDADVTRANGTALLNDLVGDVFVRLHGE